VTVCPWFRGLNRRIITQSQATVRQQIIGIIRLGRVDIGFRKRRRLFEIRGSARLPCFVVILKLAPTRLAPYNSRQIFDFERPERLRQQALDVVESPPATEWYSVTGYTAVEDDDVPERGQ